MSKLSDIGAAHRPQQRKHRRFELRYPVNVKFAQGSSVSEMRAVSNDISVGGLLLEAESRIPQNCDVSFTVMVKGHHVVGPTKIVGEGQVVRVEPHRSGAGFAIALRCERPISKLEDYFRGSVI